MTVRRTPKSLLLLAVGLCSAVAGCSSPLTSPDAKGLKFPEPDAKFVKQVERDPFPRGDGVTVAGN